MTLKSIPHERQWTLDTFSRYWPGQSELILRLPLPQVTPPHTGELPPDLCLIPLPEWAFDIGIDRSLFIPRYYVAPGTDPEWQRTDWVGTLFWFLHAVAERYHEKQFQPIHSYAFRLKEWDSRIWAHAWGNRIALFLRRWAARNLNTDEETLFGKLPQGEIWITHDVDAISKTLSIRFKQSIFQALISAKHFLNQRWDEAGRRLKNSIYFFFSRENYWLINKIIDMEQDHGIRSTFLFYGGETGLNPNKILMDPGYSVLNPKIIDQIKKLEAGGWDIGLHASYYSWKDPEQIRFERKRIGSVLTNHIKLCRQHWLRFSWSSTWKAQEEAGIEWDSTLAFNDKPGLRNGVALPFHPWNEETGSPMNLKSLPMILMDSHLYDYSSLNHSERTATMRHWLEEINRVGGSAAVNWHPHTMSPDYGWEEGFKTLLRLIVDTGLKTRTITS